MKKPPHTTVRHNQLWARMYVPAELRDRFEGRTMFLRQIGPASMPYQSALALSSALVAEWKRQIEKARSEPNWIEDWTQTWWPSQVTPDNPDNYNPADDAIELMDADGLRSALRSMLGYWQKKLPMVESAIASAVPKDDIAFLANFDEWKKKTHLKGKSLDQAASDIRQFSEAVSKPLEVLSGGDVQKWIEDLLESVSAVTVRRKLSAVRSYWSWLQSHEIVPQNRSPFDSRKVQDRRTKVEKALDKRQRFEPSEILQLIKASSDDKPLQAMIRLAAYTGARREGFASLKTNSVVKIDGITCLKLQEKTEAGIRNVPVHPEIESLVKLLIAESTDGYLIPSEFDKYNRRGDALGKRFTRLKTDLGFDEHRTFHSVRHTVVHLFRIAQCPIEIRNQILGHEGNGETGAGANYGGHIDERLKLEWLAKAIRYE